MWRMPSLSSATTTVPLPRQSDDAESEDAVVRAWVADAGKMSLNDVVGIDSGGQFAQTATGTAQLELALAKRMSPAEAGRQAFSTDGLGCASCHGEHAEGRRGPALAGGVELEEFRGVHGRGLFPATVVNDAHFAALNAWLKTLPDARRGDH
jgi:mono/diheme cytochrome c family protein